MYTKEEIWGVIEHEINVIVHLSEKIMPNTHHYKPTEKQRTLVELLQYISMMGIGTMHAMKDNNPAVFDEYAIKSKEVTLENFTNVMMMQKEEMKKIFFSFTEHDLNEVVSLWGTTARRALHVLNIIKMLAAYKMQLFLYVKASGNEHIGTSNLWAGMDMSQR